MKRLLHKTNLLKYIFLHTVHPPLVNFTSQISIQIKRNLQFKDKSQKNLFFFLANLV